MARHLAPFSCRQRMAEIVRRRSFGAVLPLGRHVSISGSRSIHAPSVSITPSSFQEEQNARHHKQFKLEQALETALEGLKALVAEANKRAEEAARRADQADGRAGELREERDRWAGAAEANAQQVSELLKRRSWWPG